MAALATLLTCIAVSACFYDDQKVNSKVVEEDFAVLGQFWDKIITLRLLLINKMLL